MELGSIFLLLAVILLVGIFISRPLFQRSDSASEVETSSEQAGDEAVYSAHPGVDSDHNRSSLLAEYDRLLNTLQELEFDHTLGKIPPEDYPPQRVALLNAGAEVLKKLDAIRAAPVVPETNDDLSLTGSAAARFASAAQMKLASDGTAAAVPTPSPSGSEPSGVELAPVSVIVPAIIPEGTLDALPAPAASLQAQAVDQTKAAEGETELELLIASRRQARSEKSSGFCPHCGKPVQKSDRFCPKCGATL